MSRKYIESTNIGGTRVGGMRRHGLLAGVLGFIASLCICFVIMGSLAELLLYPLGRTWFKHEFEKYSVLEDVRGEMSMESALDVMDELMDYLHGKRDDLEVTTTLDGQRVQFFSDREKAHLADCKILVTKLLWLRRIAIPLIIILLIIIKALRREMAKRTIANSYTIASITTLGALAFAWYKANSDFGGFFEKFHQLFFDNNLYILDPAKDNLINLLPEGFFSDTALVIAAMYIAVTFVLLLLAKKV